MLQPAYAAKAHHCHFSPTKAQNVFADLLPNVLKALAHITENTSKISNLQATALIQYLKQSLHILSPAQFLKSTGSILLAVLHIDPLDNSFR